MKWSSAIFIRAIILCAASALLIGADLPNNVPIPAPRPDVVKSQNKSETETKISEPKNDVKIVRPEPVDKAQTEEEYAPPPIEAEDPLRLKACLESLETLGVAYTEKPHIDDGNGCGIDHPIVVTAIGTHIALQPEGKMRCETALQLARWTADVLVPALKVAKPDETLSGLDQASGYICRKRNNAETGKISEHAHGNAVDIAGLKFSSGQSFSIKPRMKDSTMDGALQRAITSAACLYFTTVLDPGSDKAHETHLHLDVMKRKGGYRYCW